LKKVGILRKLVLYFLFFMLAGGGAAGQSLYQDHRTVVGAGGGLLLLFGDIGNMGTGYDLNLQVIKHINNYWAVRLFIQYGTASDSDKGTPNDARNYAYKSSMYRISLQGSYLFYRKVTRGYSRMGLLRYWNRWQTEVLMGPGVIGYHVVPGGRLTEEIMTRTRGTAFIMPVGVAIQYGISCDLAVRGELMPTFIFADHIDGYASPHSESNDFMYNLSVSVIYTISW
jgi:hypothetical protein